MRILPEEKIINKDILIEAQRLKTEKITRIVALVVAFISVFFL